MVQEQVKNVLVRAAARCGGSVIELQLPLATLAAGAKAILAALKRTLAAGGRRCQH